MKLLSKLYRLHNRSLGSQYCFKNSVTSLTMQNSNIISYQFYSRLKINQQKFIGLVALAPGLSHKKPKLFYSTKSCKFEIENNENRTTFCNKNHLHIPVMVNKVVDIIKPFENMVVVDMTFGAGGYSLQLLKQSPKIKVFGLDRDPEAFRQAEQIAENYPQLTPLRGNFSEAHNLLGKYNYGENSIDAIMFDVGPSSMQFDTSERGFSISRDGPLDMRMDPNSQVTAADVVNHMDEDGLRKVIKKYGEEKMARQISRAIVDHRYAFGRISTTQQLATVVATVFEGSYKRDKLMRHSHVATKTFQALRIFVNNELNELNNGLEMAFRLLKPGGVCVAVTFHSLEDRIVKRLFHGIDMDTKLNMSVSDRLRNAAKLHREDEIRQLVQKKWKPLYRKILVPSDEDVASNPRARSAKLRAAVKLGESSEG